MGEGRWARAALVLANDKDRRPFDEFDSDLAGRLAERAAIAIQNARMASERSRIAETLQRGLAPPTIPEIPGWATAAVYRPALALSRGIDSMSISTIIFFYASALAELSSRRALGISRPLGIFHVQ